MSEPTSLGPRTLGATLQRGGGTFGRAAKAFGLPAADWENGKKLFFFHRRKDRDTGQWGVDIWFHVDAYGFNLTVQKVAPFLRTLNEARGWAIDFAKAHGFVARTREKPKKRARPKLTLVHGGEE